MTTSEDEGCCLCIGVYIYIYNCIYVYIILYYIILYCIYIYIKHKPTKHGEVIQHVAVLWIFMCLCS